MPSFLVDILRLTLWLVLLTVIFVPLERLFSVERQPILRKQAVVDLAYYFLNSLATTAALAFGLAILAAGLHQVVPAPLLALTAGLPFWARFAASLVVGEIGFYWGHRWSHEIPLLWRFHAVHHSAEELDFLSNTRAHPVDMAFTRLCGFVPLYVVGLAQGSGQRADVAPALVVLVGTVWGFFIHANINWRFGWLESLIATPAFHRWHHTNDDYRDHNYAAMLPLFDRLFGTFHVPAAWPPSYGIDAAMSPKLVNQLLLVSPRRPSGRWSAPPQDQTGSQADHAAMGAPTNGS